MEESAGRQCERITRICETLALATRDVNQIVCIYVNAVTMTLFPSHTVYLVAS